MYIALEIEGVTYSCKLIYTYLQNSAQNRRSTLASHPHLQSRTAMKSLRLKLMRGSTAGLQKLMMHG